MLDNGFPLATESNILKELIKPPTILRTMVNTITGTVVVVVLGTLALKCCQEREEYVSFLSSLLVGWFGGLPGSTNVGEQLPTGQLSVVPWRRTGVKYTNNEAYFDVVEEIDAIIDKSGIPLDQQVQDSPVVSHLSL